MSLTKNVTEPLTRSVLISLGLKAVASTADERILKKKSGTITLLVSSDKIHDIIEIVKSLEDSGLLLKRVSETIQNEAKEQKEGFPGMLLGALCVSLLRNILAGKVN